MIVLHRRLELNCEAEVGNTVVAKSALHGINSTFIQSLVNTLLKNEAGLQLVHRDRPLPVIREELHSVVYKAVEKQGSGHFPQHTVHGL